QRSCTGGPGAASVSVTLGTRADSERSGPSLPPRERTKHWSREARGPSSSPPLLLSCLPPDDIPCSCDRPRAEVSKFPPRAARLTMRHTFLLPGWPFEVGRDIACKPQIPLGP